MTRLPHLALAVLLSGAVALPAFAQPTTASGSQPVAKTSAAPAQPVVKAEAKPQGAMKPAEIKKQPATGHAAVAAPATNPPKVTN
jgi:hypothetical protein